METVVQDLRSGTRDLHTLLEKLPISRDLMSPHLSREQYIAALKIWATVWQALEECLEACLLPGGYKRLMPTKRANLAFKDLITLEGKDSLSPKYLAIPGHWRSNLFRTTHAALGICYVMRGASLGAKLISKNLNNTLGIGAHTGGAFFSVQIEETLTWPLWGRTLEELGLDTSDREDVINTARETFNWIIQAFQA